ncbi:MAG: lipoyl synthase [Candidatus Cloacimonetes bacterium]|nr:lipoyl synthase [Candidatus Cloacimonadota bacterium]
MDKKPTWLKANRLGSKKASEINAYLRSLNLHTVCESAKCPNRGECFDRGTATVMILGEVCTRNCRFCAVEKSKGTLLPADPNEPENIAEMAQKLQLKHLVITTVTRDDLSDGGAGQFVKTINYVHKKCETVSIEVLISDLEGDWNSLRSIVEAKPDIVNHNLETVPRLYPDVRPMAVYERSLDLLRQVKLFDPSMITKSGIMVGLGETEEEVIELMKDLRGVDCNILTIGQYLSPSAEHHPVVEYIHPDLFNRYRDIGEELGFIFVESGPLVRSSYHAEKARDFIKI